MDVQCFPTNITYRFEIFIKSAIPQVSCLVSSTLPRRCGRVVAPAEQEYSILTPPFSESSPDLLVMDRQRFTDVSSKQSKRSHDSRVFYPRKRAILACQVCRRKKTKCDNARPSCGSCQELNIDCRYSDSKFDNSTWVVSFGYPGLSIC